VLARAIATIDRAASSLPPDRAAAVWRLPFNQELRAFVAELG
jgi:hypothetical protein